MITYKKAFTLIELLIVIVIIGILATALIPRITGLQGKARDAVRKSDIQQLATALKQYEMETNQYPSGFACIGKTPGEECRPGYIQNEPQGGGDGGTGAKALGSGDFDTLLLQYMKSIPIDPLPNRTIGERYIYRKGGGDIHCSQAETVNNKARIARQPEKTSPNSDEACAPGKRGCCSRLGCGKSYFCMLQLD